MIISTTKFHLNQLKHICEELTNEQLKEKLLVLNGSSIGAHVRHILEFYLCLLNGEQLSKVCYDNRKRDKSLETNKNKCIETIDLILEDVCKNIGDYELKLYVNYSTIDDESLYPVQTSYYRELAYNLDHIVHHLAIIKIGVKSLEKPISLDENLGVAISTIRNHKNKEICVQ